MRNVDSIIVGGGIAGLLTALRLARAGQDVTLVEADRLGAGATVANHGIVHSGALFVRRHPHIVPLCRQAQPLFATLAGGAEIATSPAVYAVAGAEGDEFLTALDRYAIPAGVPTDAALAEVSDAVRASGRLVTVPERVFSSRGILTAAAAQALAAGVEIHVGTAVHAVDHEYGKVTGVLLASGERVTARNVVLAAGTGIAPLLAGPAPAQAGLLAARLDTMLHFPAATITHGLVQPVVGRPVVMPTAHGGALSSFHGGLQPPIVGRRAHAVPLDKADALRAATAASFAPGLLGADVVAYVAGKVDYVGSPTTEYAGVGGLGGRGGGGSPGRGGESRGRVNPAFHVIDHAETDDVSGLYTVVAGKMTLAFHASRAAAEAVLGTGLDLTLESVPATGVPDGMVALEPWAAPEVAGDGPG